MIEIPNWADLQHYRDRDPTWIKLYRRLLHKREWRELSGDAAKLLIDLWMLAAESEELGKIDHDSDSLAWCLRVASKSLAQPLKELEDKGLVVVASNTLASCYQVASPEERREEKSRTSEKEKNDFVDELEKLWQLAPGRGSKKKAKTELKRALTKTDIESLLTARSAHVRAASAPKYIKHLETWLRDERWTDIEASPKRNGGPPPFWTPEEVEALG